MSNEEYLEEILHEAYRLGVVSEIISRVPENVQNRERTDAFLKAFHEVVKEKNLEHTL
jgi:hypothetical protein